MIAKLWVLAQLDFVASVQDPFQRSRDRRQRALALHAPLAHPSDAVGIRILAERAADGILDPGQRFAPDIRTIDRWRDDPAEFRFLGEFVVPVARIGIVSVVTTSIGVPSLVTRPLTSAYFA